MARLNTAPKVILAVVILSVVVFLRISLVDCRLTVTSTKICFEASLGVSSVVYDANGIERIWFRDTENSIRRYLPSRFHSGTIQSGISVLYPPHKLKLATTVGRSLYPHQSSIFQRFVGFLSILAPQKTSIEAVYHNILVTHYRGIEIRGFEAASRLFFSKSSAQLTDAQALLLVATSQRPSYLSPIHNPKEAQKARNLLAEKMSILGWSKQRIEKVKIEPLVLEASNVDIGGTGTIASLVEREMLKNVEIRDWRQKGLKIDSTIMYDLQNTVQDSLSGMLNYLQTEYQASENRKVNFSLILLEPSSGAIQSFWTSDHERPIGSFIDKKATGSILKPLLYAIALSREQDGKKSYPPSYILPNIPRKYPESGRWSPKNFNANAPEYVTLQEAFVQSENIAAVELLRLLGGPNVFIEKAKELSFDVRTWPSELGLVLGQAESTLVEVASMSLPLVNGGRLYPVSIINSVSDVQNHDLYKREDAFLQVFDPQTSLLIKNFMQKTTEEGTGKAASKSDFCRVGTTKYSKTGSSNQYRELWFMGGNEHIMGVMLLHLSDSTTLRGPSSVITASLWSKLFDDLVKNHVLKCDGSLY